MTPSHHLCLRKGSVIGLYLYQHGYAPTLIFTGGFGGSSARFAESQEARRYALRYDVPSRAILIETVSRTTPSEPDPGASAHACLWVATRYCGE